jgi:hypothetical protein
VPTKKPVKTANPVLTSSEDYPPPPPPTKPVSKERLTSDVFKDVTIGKWGIASLSVPQDLTSESESSTPHKNKDVSWVTYSRSWKQAAEYYPSSLEVDLDVTNWNADFKTIIPDLRADLATPETLLMIDIAGDEKNKDTPGSNVKEAYPLTVSGVKGGFFRADFPSDSGRFMAGWYTYRYFEGKAQRISFTVTGSKSELPKLMRIIQSLVIQESNTKSST